MLVDKLLTKRCSTNLRSSVYCLQNSSYGYTHWHTHIYPSWHYCKAFLPHWYTHTDINIDKLAFFYQYTTKKNIPTKLHFLPLHQFYKITKKEINRHFCLYTNTTDLRQILNQTNHYSTDKNRKPSFFITITLLRLRKHLQTFRDITKTEIKRWEHESDFVYSMRFWKR